MENIDLHDEINGCSEGLVEVNIVTGVHLASHVGIARNRM